MDEKPRGLPFSISSKISRIPDKVSIMVATIITAAIQPTMKEARSYLRIK
jgi:hypothetical protein